jgi:hypothetical protein
MIQKKETLREALALADPQSASRLIGCQLFKPN